MQSVDITTLKILAITSIGMLNACAFSTPYESDKQIQEAALQRWANCISRYSTNVLQQRSQSALKNDAGEHCEGHRRDVLKTFPEYLENQVRMLLSQRASVMTAARFVKMEGRDAWTDSQDSHIDTIKSRLLETSKGDL